MASTWPQLDGLVSNRSRLLAMAVLLVAGVAFGCASPSPAPKLEPSGVYRVGAPDVLTITVLPEPAIERQAIVRPDGMISIDLIGDVPAAGRTPEEIAADVEKRISKYKRGARATVAVSVAQSSTITILGEVSAPSTFSLNKDTRLIEAIGAVGGPTRFAAESRVRIVRSFGGSPRVLSANLSAIQNGDLSTNYKLEAGDLIVVPPTVWASIGYGIQAVTFPLSQLFGFGGNVATTVVTGGTGRGVGN